jgi:hypothetical protein
MDLVFITGDVAGEYRTTITLNGGNSVQMNVIAE